MHAEDENDINVDDDSVYSWNYYETYNPTDIYFPTSNNSFDPRYVLLEDDIIPVFESWWGVVEAEKDENDPDLLKDGGEDIEMDYEAYSEAMNNVVSMMRHDIMYFLRLICACNQSTISPRLGSVELSVQDGGTHIVQAMMLSYFSGMSTVHQKTLQHWNQATWLRNQEIWKAFMMIYNDPMQPDHIHSWMHAWGLDLKGWLTDVERAKDMLPASEPATLRA